MEYELPQYLEITVFPQQTPTISTTMFRDREQTKPVKLSLLDQVIGLLIKGTNTYRIKLQFQVKFTLLRKPTNVPDKSKLGQPYGLKFQRMSNESMIEFYCEKQKKQLIEWRDHLALKINQRGFHQLIKPYKKIGKGNAATVYLAQRFEDKKIVAVKAFAKEALTVEIKGKQSLMNEINILRSMNHKCLMKLYEVFESENSFYLLIEHLDGGQLFQKLNNRRFKLSQIQQILRNLVEGLTQMHKKRLIHRDLKPQNLIFRTAGINDIVIADFGLATWADAPEYIFVRCGTPGYVAPQIINCKTKNGQQPISDIFSLGVITHILATGRSPFPGKQYNQVLAENRQCNFNFELEIYKNVQPRLLNLVIKMLEIDPKKRIKTQQILDHQFFKFDFKEISQTIQEDQPGLIGGVQKGKKKDYTKLQDSVGSFIVAKPNVIKGTDSECMSMTSAGSANSVVTSPQSIKLSKFNSGKRQRQPEMESIFKKQAEGTQRRKKSSKNQRVGLDELKDK